MHYAVIMAGGGGTRFWPVSTPRRPKQLLTLYDHKTMIEATLERVEPVIPLERQRVVTIAEQVPLLLNTVDRLEQAHFIIEPFAKNTAPAIALSAMTLLANDPDAVMVVLPADHRIDGDEEFQEVLKRALHTVEERDALVTIGITPSRPETGYGYIQYDPEALEPGLHRVITFAEKPNLETAIRFLETGEFLWNSGIFVWSARRILAELEEYQPELYAAMDEIGEALGGEKEAELVNRAYRSIKPISIDYGVMEHTRNAYVVPGKFQWSDVGSWGELYRVSTKDESGNAVHGPVRLLDTEDSYILTDSTAPIAVIGMKGVIVVHTEDGLLICPLDRDQDVSEVAKRVLKDVQRGAGE